MRARERVGMYIFTSRLRKNPQNNNQMNVINMQNTSHPRQGLTVQPWLSGNSLCRPGWPGVHKDPSASAGIKGMFPMPYTGRHLNPSGLNSKPHMC